MPPVRMVLTVTGHRYAGAMGHGEHPSTRATPTLGGD